MIDQLIAKYFELSEKVRQHMTDSSAAHYIYWYNERSAVLRRLKALAGESAYTLLLDEYDKRLAAEIAARGQEVTNIPLQIGG